MKKRIVYLDALKILAILFVLYNHTKIYGYDLYTVTDSRIDYWLSIACDVLCKTGVPLFLMTSGALLLNKEESLPELFKKRILRYGITFAVFVFLQYLRRLHSGMSNSFSILEYLSFLYSKDVIAPYWFLRGYLSYLLILPFLRILAKHLKPEHYLWLIGLELLLSADRYITLVSGETYAMPFEFNTDWIFYPLLGFFLFTGMYEKTFLKKLKKTGFSWILLVLTTIAGCLIEGFAYPVFGENEAYFSPLVWILSILIFHLFSEHQFAHEEMMAEFGSCTLGIYLIEDIVRNRLEFLIPILSPVIGRMGAVLVFVILCFSAGVIAVKIVRHLPGFRYMLG